MDFRKATDELFAGLSHEDLARVLDVSIATVRQARLQPTARAHRSPPEGWESAVAKLAETQIRHYKRLVEELRGRLLPKSGRAA